MLGSALAWAIHNSFSLVETRLHTEFQLLGGRFMVGERTKQQQVSMKLIDSLAPAWAEVEAGVVAKADQKYIF